MPHTRGMSIQVKRPTEVSEIRALIRERARNIKRLENLLKNPMPRDLRRITQQRLKGERANRQSWIDYLEKRVA